MIRSLARRTHPIVRKDTRRRPRRRRLRGVLSGPLPAISLMLLLTILGFSLSSATYYAFCQYGFGCQYGPPDQVGAMLYNLYSGLSFAIFLGGWTTGLLGASAGGPLIAQEFNRRTWDLLAATPLSTAEIVRAKFAAGMWRLRRWLTAQFTLRWVFVFFSLGLLVLDLTHPGNVRYILQGDSEAWARDVFARAPIGAVAFCLTFALFVLVQPLLTAAGGVSLGALCSTLTQSPALARGLALAARITLWVFSWGSMFHAMARLELWRLDYASSRFLEQMVQMTGHMHDPAQLAGALSDFRYDWLLVPGLALIVALALVPTWLCLRLASAVLSRRRP
jgi:hypothetical protein